MDINLLLQLVVNGLIVGALYGVVAMCFELVYKASQVVNFAQGEFLLIGAWMYMLATNLMRTRDGRALVAVRDHHLSAEMMGINLTKYRTMSFGH